MKSIKNIAIVLILLTFKSQAQQVFTSIDTLFTKTYKTINDKDSTAYMSLFNWQAIYKDKKCKNKNDSLVLIKPFCDSYSQLVAELTDVAGTTDFTVNYDSYDNLHKIEVASTKQQLIRLYPKLIINNTFSVKKAFNIQSKNGSYTIESPLLVGFLVD